ncbi:MAG: [protein-PII] uridylyltransferase [Deltaproteobacteria bacterium]|nr:[protein-PII] uridylyltransferase [Deltaproteobacteria bacterium]
MPAAPPVSSVPPGPAACEPRLTATLREYLVRYRGEFDARIRGGAAASDAGRAYARTIDGLLSALLPCTQASLGRTGKWIDCTLAGVGSYGRGLLAPRSDLDVRIVVDHDSDRAQEVAEALLYPLWDAGCSVGHQVLAIDDALELARTDLTTATSLLDLRVVAGPRARVDALVERALGGFFQADIGGFVRRLREERASRHGKYGGSLFLLEPDVKSGAGGLRDLDIARWAARARYGVKELAGLVTLGVLLPREHQEIAAAEAFLWNVRSRLHVRADRRSDRLTFDAQEEIGRAHGEAAPSSSRAGQPPDEPDAVAAERLMQRYYGHARTVERLVERVLDLCAPPRARGRQVQQEVLAKGVRTFDGHATLEHPAHVYNEPALAMRLYHAAMRRGLPVYPYTRDAITRAAREPEFAAALRASPEAKQLFLECLTTVADRLVHEQGPGHEQVRTGGSILRELHDVGLLLAMIPEFDPVVGRVHHDIYHVYTVDVHSVAAVDRLRTLARGELASEYPLACRLAGDNQRKVPLYVATLLHDVGKGAGGAGHSERGAEMSRPICARLGLSQEDAEEVRWLISEHLTMYHVATRRDLDDPATVAGFAETIAKSGGSPLERLQHLYLLTVADISTTSPTAMTSWKARMLDDLFLATSHHLASQQRGVDTADVILARVRREALEAALALRVDREGKGDPRWITAYLEGMPKSYFIGHGGAQVAAHAAVVERRKDKSVVVDVVPSRHADAIELCIAADDRPGLLAMIAAALAANRLDVMTAHIFLRPLYQRDGGKSEAVDFFSVRRFARDGEEAIEPLSERELARIGSDLQALLAGSVEAEALLRERRGAGGMRERPAPAVATGVEIDDRASRRFTVIDVYAKDRPGLLYTIARALHDAGLSIARSKIATEGARAADSFYVTEIDGSKVRDAARREEIKRVIGAAIERLAREGIAA